MTSDSSDNSYMSESDEEGIDIQATAKNITNKLVPHKSEAKYNLSYQNFINWTLKNKIKDFTEDVFLVYFDELSKTNKPSTLWSKWSMVKSLVKLYHGVDINNFNRLKTFMKIQSKGYRAKKSKVLTWGQITQFLNEALDETRLDEKVILIFGFCGALRCKEFCQLNKNDVDDTGSHFIVSVNDTKNCYPRTFVIKDEFYNTVKKYIDLRPKDCSIERFFLRYEKGRCMRQAIGKNKITEIPKNIVSFLNLPDQSGYTGHCFRRTSTTLLANAGASVTTLKQHGGWKSSHVAEGYVENSLHNKNKIFNKIVQSENVELMYENNPTTNTTASFSEMSSKRPVEEKFERPQSLPPTKKVRFTGKPRNCDPQNPKPSTSTSSCELPAEKINSPEVLEDLENIENFDFETPFYSIPNENPNFKTTNNHQKLNLQEETATETLNALNLKSAIINIQNCTIINVTINYPKK